MSPGILTLIVALPEYEFIMQCIHHLLIIYNWDHLFYPGKVLIEYNYFKGMFSLIFQLQAAEDNMETQTDMRSRSREDEFHSRPSTQALEEKTSVPPQLAGTLEHIVGQLDILTQVRK